MIVRAHPLQIARNDRPHPATGREAKVSIQYTLPVALIRGTVSVPDYLESAVADPQVAELGRRVVVVEDRKCGAGLGLLPNRDDRRPIAGLSGQGRARQSGTSAGRRRSRGKGHPADRMGCAIVGRAASPRCSVVIRYCGRHSADSCADHSRLDPPRSFCTPCGKPVAPAIHRRPLLKPDCRTCHLPRSNAGWIRAAAFWFSRLPATGESCAPRRRR